MIKHIAVFALSSSIMAQSQFSDLELLQLDKERMQERIEATLALKQQIFDAGKVGVAITHSAASLAHLQCRQLMDAAQLDPMPFSTTRNIQRAVLSIRIDYLKAVAESCKSIEAIKQIGSRPTKVTLQTQTQASIEAEQRMVQHMKKAIEQHNTLVASIQKQENQGKP